MEPQATLPECKTPGAAGYDLTPGEDITLQPGKQKLINLSLAMEIPPGYYGQLAA
jgi:dUTPase